MKRCPICGILIDERFRYCECGYDWAIPEEDYRRTPAGRAQRAQRRRRLLRWPVAIIVVCLLVPAVAAALLVVSAVIWILLSGGKTRS